MVKEIPLQNGMVALVDDEDYERCMEYVWTVSTNSRSYRVESEVNGKRTLLQSFIKEPKEGYRLTFLNKNQLDFRKNNIIHSTRSEISRNSKGRRGSSSKYKGVSWSKANRKWVAVIYLSGRNKYLGQFLNEDDAAMAYNAAAIEKMGENCFLNVIGEDNNAKEIRLENSLFNRKRNLQSPFRGVRFRKESKKWLSQIYFKGRCIHLGSFQTEQEAARAYDKKAIELHGDKAILNFPDEVMKL